MASHKNVPTHRASKKTITAPRTAVTLATATVGSIALVPGLAHADPSANLNDVDQVNDLHQQAEQASRPSTRRPATWPRSSTRSTRSRPGSPPSRRS